MTISWGNQEPGDPGLKAKSQPWTTVICPYCGWTTSRRRASKADTHLDRHIQKKHPGKTLRPLESRR
jgi:BED zinc finger